MGYINDLELAVQAPYRGEVVIGAHRRYEIVCIVIQ